MPDTQPPLTEAAQLNTWYVYVVECGDGTYYTGITTDIERRLTEHNSSSLGARYTRSRRPVRLHYHETSSSRSDALKRELQIKKLSRRNKRLLASPIQINAAG